MGVESLEEMFQKNISRIASDLNTRPKEERGVDEKL
jgi:hypothetical protein